MKMDAVQYLRDHAKGLVIFGMMVFVVLGTLYAITN
jgi:hypothetical protein